jgi:hypothetical protein
MLGNFDLASRDIELIDDSKGVFYVYSVTPEKNVGQFSVLDLKEMIKSSGSEIKTST